MSIISGPKIIDDGLVFYIDSTNRKSISALGNASFNTAPEVIRNLTSGVTVSSYNGVNVGNLNYYTVFAIDYPEGTYGGDAAGRHGMTPGLNVRSGTKTYDSSRSLHMWVWNNETSSWLASSFFNGYRLSGHCYDNYTGAEDGYVNQINKFITDFNNIKKRFTNCTYIITGSHRADRYNSTLRAILYDLGMPTGTALDSDYVAAPEWILVGEPGLGSGNAYGWVYQNYTTNAAQVAHLNFGLPIYGNSGNYLTFDGVNDYVTTNISTINTSATYSVWLNRTASANEYNMFMGQYLPYFAFRANGQIHFSMSIGGQQSLLSTISLSNSTWYNLTFVHNYNGTNTTASIYINGSLNASASYTGSQSTSSGRNFMIGGWRTDAPTEYPFYGKISQVSIYNRALSDSEIKQNFEAHRKKYGI
jgi:hypothetical protein